MEWSCVRREHVLAAIEECDRLGEDEFLAQHSFRRSRTYHLVYRGASYPSKAILGVAYGHATGVTASWQDFSGGKNGAAKVLRDLDFEIRGPEG